MDQTLSFFALLERIKDFGSLKSPDFVVYALPLLEEAAKLHELNQVRYITKIEQVEYVDNRLRIIGEPRQFQHSVEPLFVKSNVKSVIEVTSHFKEDIDLEKNNSTYSNLEIYLDNLSNLNQPAYLLNYKTWDYNAKRHYDPITEVFVLGQMFASIAFGLDFRDKEDLELFVNNRKRLYFLNQHLHPTLLSVIYEMTHLYREDRSVNLEEVITKLKHYREYNPENYVDLTQTEGFRNQDLTNRNDWILAKLKNRLFDISRRNKLLYFTDRQNFLNLTIASVPLLLDHMNIQEKDLIFWNEGIEKKVIKSKKLILNNYLEFKENRFLAPTLNKIRLDAQKSLNEYGFSQLRTVLAFVHWYNFKEDSDERITSPLLLLNSQVVKKKAVVDQYIVEFPSSEAEVNPVLSYYLKELYDIILPDFIDLETTAIGDLVSSIQNQIEAGSTGIKLEWRNKPKIQLIHKIAKKNFSLKSQKLERRSSGLNLRNFAYSYDQDDFQPLGLQVFNDRIRQKNSALEFIINEDLNPKANYAVEEKVRSFYSNDNEGEINPLVWEIDTCNLTIGNFNYRKMSLVRDYNEIIDAKIKDEIFEQLFSDEPRKVQPISNSASDLKQSYPIISADPTQTAAIQIARTGESYIIQGPPGTGKSQTITNLIADYISRDKKILFVCEKRAALDVVFHRLKNKRLDELCCLIHDSQTDKKAFIQNLKDTYENFISNELNISEIEANRDKVINAINQEMDKLRYFHEIMSTDNAQISPLHLFEIMHATGKGRTADTEIEQINYPEYSEWNEHRDWVSEWVEQLKINGFSRYIKDYPFACLSSEILSLNNPKSVLLEKLQRCTNTLDQFNELLDDLDVEPAENVPLISWIEKLTLANRIIGIVNKSKLQVFNPNSSEANELWQIEKDVRVEEQRRDELISQMKQWKEPLSKEETTSALAQWEQFNGSIFRFLNPRFYKLKAQITSAYDFKASRITPEIDVILKTRLAYFKSEETIVQLKGRIFSDFGIENFDEEMSWIKSNIQQPNPILKYWYLNQKSEEILALSNFKELFDVMISDVNIIFGNRNKVGLNELEMLFSNAQSSLNSLAVFMPFISKANGCSDSLKTCMVSKSWVLQDFDFQLAYKALSKIYELERQFSDMDGDSLDVSIYRINALLDSYYSSNVDSIIGSIRTRFMNQIRISESVAAMLTPEEKIDKKSYVSARRILENEFGKSMRYKSVRELVSSDAGVMMSAIKPVWLMSPLSVSDTMPVDPNLFDVVIYDEASQITVEEGVPSLFRTKQTIIVGDEMQMPPTNFFSSSNNVEEEEEQNEDKIGISLDADSLLNQGSRKLSSVMLGWHYRSRHESLISFSNAAFYKRSLLTIPDIVANQTEKDIISPIVSLDKEVDIESILNRSISFCYLENAVYEKRKNKDEAAYIAKIVRQLLNQRKKLSIGIVAFSMEQQSQIESALDNLAVKDADFERKLEAEYQRIDEDQFNGLFVKNLENVQGDERDIIIMSVCYGANANGKMLMNFGPINRRGGEKRLNVIFSRAKKRMVVVTSILPNEIKNDYNEGANYFKRFLQYAKSMSDGRLQDANLILDGLFKFSDDVESRSNSHLVEQVKKSLIEKGYEIDTNIGQSHFKCDLAVKKPGETNYSLGILIDKSEHYLNKNILEQYCQKPEILTSFGWRIARVFAKDWLEKPERVLEKIDQQLLGVVVPKNDEVNKLLNMDRPAMNDRRIDSVNTLHNESEDLIIEDVLEKKPSSSDEQIEVGQFERYEYVEGSSKKYWQIAIVETKVVVQYGRIGNRPQISEKAFLTVEKANSEKNKMAAKKVSKGYVLVSK